MSTTPSYQLFQAHRRQGPTLESLILRCIQDAAPKTDNDLSPSPRSSSSGVEPSLVKEIGDYLCEHASMLSHVTDNLVNGPHMEAAMAELHERGREEHRLSDLSALADMDVKLERLRKVQALTYSFANDIRNALGPSTRLPYIKDESYDEEVVAGSYIAGSQDPVTSPLFSNQSPTSRSPRASRGGKAPSRHGQGQAKFSSKNRRGSLVESSESSADEDLSAFDNVDLKSLKSRGRGEYTCPLGSKCRKGGYDVSKGEMVVFAHNSAFAQHCNRHSKPFKCERPGCPNSKKKRRFARRDGLDRHLKHVPHLPDDFPEGNSFGYYESARTS